MIPGPNGRFHLFFRTLRGNSAPGPRVSGKRATRKNSEERPPSPAEARGAPQRGTCPRAPPPPLTPPRPPRLGPGVRAHHLRPPGPARGRAAEG
eukprot:15438092-Alexandrium_andersonii.AAC.1